MGRRHLDGEVSDRGPIEVGRRSLSLSVATQVVLWFASRFGGLLRRLMTHPVGLSVVLTGVLLIRGGLALAVLWHGAVAALLGVVLVLDRESFHRRITERVRGWWRGIAVYRPGWEQVLTARRVALVERDSSRAGVVLPSIKHLRSTRGRDVVRVRMLPGQLLSDWVEVCDRLAVTFGCREDSARVGSAVSWRPGWWPSWLPAGRTLTRDVDLSFLHVDPLAELVDAHPVADVPNLKALPVARREDGTWYRLRLLGQHLFIAGATGAGKGSVLWSIITQLSGGIRSGLVQFVGLDPKGGIELGMGRHLFHVLCRGEVDRAAGITTPEEAYAAVLEHWVEVMRERQARMFARLRLHRPTVDEPYIVIVVDELAALVAKAYQSDPKAGERVVAALNILLSQGRAMGITVIGAVQDPRKESVPMRGLFTIRLGLRLNEANDVDMVLGDGSRARGAWCDRIRGDRPGTAYAVDEGSPEPVRMRFPFTDDDSIRALPTAPGQPGPIDLAVDVDARPTLGVVPTQPAAEPVPAWLPDEFRQDGDAA